MKYIMLRDEKYSFNGCTSQPYIKGEILTDPPEVLVKVFTKDMRPPAMRQLSQAEIQEAYTEAMDRNPGVDPEIQDMDFEVKEKPRKGRKGNRV